jgi:folate-binding protein YgfZ
MDTMLGDLIVPEGFAPAYRALREAAGACYSERDLVSLRGPDSLELLQSQLTQDLSSLAVGGSAESLVLSPKGRLDAYLRVTRAAPDWLVLDVAAGWGPAVLERLERFRIRARVEISPLEWQCLSIKGPETTSLYGALEPGSSHQPGGANIVDASWPGLPGLDILGPAPTVPPGVQLLSDLTTPQGAPESPWLAWEAVRIEAGIPAMGKELTTRSIPAETGLLERTVSFTKGCYTGQELVARMAARHNRAPRRICGLVLGSSDMAQTVEPSSPWPRPGSEVRLDGAACGIVTTSSISLQLQAPVALAIVSRDVPLPSEVSVSDAGYIRAASARELPLIR